MWAEHQQLASLPPCLLLWTLYLWSFQSRYIAKAYWGQLAQSQFSQSIIAAMTSPAASCHTGACGKEDSLPVWVFVCRREMCHKDYLHVYVHMYCTRDARHGRCMCVCMGESIACLGVEKLWTSMNSVWTQIAWSMLYMIHALCTTSAHLIVHTLG